MAHKLSFITEKSSLVLVIHKKKLVLKSLNEFCVLYALVKMKFLQNVS